MKRTHKQTLKAILEVMKDGKEHSYGEIERRANTNWQTVRDHIELLEIFESVERDNNNNKVKITGKGRRNLEKLS